MELRNQYQSQRQGPRRARRPAAFHQEKKWQHRHHGFDVRTLGVAGISRLLRDQSRNYQSHARDGARLRSARNPHQLRCPGAIETPRFRGFPPRPTLGEGMTDEQRKTMGASNKALLRMGRPEEIAYGVLFLVSEEASFVTGHALVVDGGQTIDA